MKSLKLDISEPTRVDVAVAAVLQVSRSKVQKAIKAGQILVNDETVTPHLEVTGEETVTYDEAAFAPKQKSTDAPPKLEVLFEDDDTLVINKPAGLLVHETDTSTEVTLVDALLAYDASIAEVGDDARRAGLVHRLDKDASGVMVVAKTNEAFKWLKRQFMDRDTKKTYSVLVKGVMEKPTDTITLTISRSKSHGRMAAKPESQGGKEAITHYTVVKQYPHHALLDVTIETGRTHQIRAHMFALAHPVVGDKLYRLKGVTPRPIGRLFLHARELTITLLSGETKTFTAPLPTELEDVLEDIPKL